jgi:hypothetical protein
MMDLDRIDAYRFKSVDHAKRRMVWAELAQFVHRITGRPDVMLDPAAGMGEFINQVPSRERWAVDMNGPFLREHAAPDVEQVVADTLTADLPMDHFGGVFVSNFLEHLHTQEEVAAFLQKLHGHLKLGRRSSLPLPFRESLAVNRFLVRAYLAMRWAQRFLGKQFLVIGRK